MNIFSLTLKNVKAKPLPTTLSLILLVLGVGLISLMFQIDRHLQGQMNNNIRGIDMVVGAKGSPLQLVLSAVFHIDVPTGNIQLAEAETLQKNRLVDYGIPLSYGDSYENFRIVGTTKNYPDLYRMKVSEGRLWQGSMEVSIGSKVAEKTGLRTGDTFLGSHGLSEGGHVHEESTYVVTGIFEPSGSVIDQLILTALESVWDVHDDHSHHSETVKLSDAEAHDKEHKNHGDEDKPYQNDGAARESHAHDGHHEPHEHKASREITAMLIKFRNPMGMVQLPRMVNENTDMQAALPGYELQKLFSLMGIAVNTLNLVALVMIVVSGVSVFISLYVTLKERTYEMALLRTYGASRRQLLGMVFQEGLLIAFAGYLLGLVLSRIGLSVISFLLKSDYLYDFSPAVVLSEEWLLLGIILAIGFFSAVIPARNVFRINLSKTLADA